MALRKREFKPESGNVDTYATISHEKAVLYFCILDKEAEVYKWGDYVKVRRNIITPHQRREQRKMSRK